MGSTTLVPGTGGVAVEFRVGESITLQAEGRPPITLTLESKSGQRSRVRIQAADNVQIARPVKKLVGVS